MPVGTRPRGRVGLLQQMGDSISERAGRAIKGAGAAYGGNQFALPIERSAAIMACVNVGFHPQPFAFLKLVIEIQGNLF